MTDLAARALDARQFAGEMWSSAADSAERTRAQLEHHPELTAIAFGLAALLLVLVGLVAGALRRSSRRHLASHLRDDLVDAVRMGEIDPDDFRVFAMIDFCDRVARRGRRPHSGRHASSRPVLDSALASSLISAVGPGSLLPPGGPFWPYAAPEPGEVEVSDVWVRAVSFQRDLMGKRRSRTDAVEPMPTPGSGPARRRLVSVPTPTTIDLRGIRAVPSPVLADAWAPPSGDLEEVSPGETRAENREIDAAVAGAVVSASETGTLAVELVSEPGTLSAGSAPEPGTSSAELISEPGTPSIGSVQERRTLSVEPVSERETLSVGPLSVGPVSEPGTLPVGSVSEWGTLSVGSGAHEGVLSAESAADLRSLIEDEAMRAEADAVRLLEIVPNPGWADEDTGPVKIAVTGDTGEETAACVEETETEIESSAGDWFLEGQARPFDPLTDPLTTPTFRRGDEPSQELEPVFMAAAEAQQAAEHALREHREHREQQRILRERVARRWEAIEQVAQERASQEAPASVREIDLRALEAPRHIDLTRSESSEPSDQLEPVSAQRPRVPQSLQALIQRPAPRSDALVGSVPAGVGDARSSRAESGGAMSSGLVDSGLVDSGSVDSGSAEPGRAPSGRAGAGASGPAWSAAARPESGGSGSGAHGSGSVEPDRAAAERAGGGASESVRVALSGSEAGDAGSGPVDSGSAEPSPAPSGHTETGASGSAAATAGRAESGRAHTSRSEAGGVEVGLDEAAGSELGSARSRRVGVGRVDSGHVGNGRAESGAVEPDRAASIGGEPSSSDTIRGEMRRAVKRSAGFGSRQAGMAKHAISGPINLPLGLRRNQAPEPSGNQAQGSTAQEAVPEEIPSREVPAREKEEAPPTNPIPRLDLPAANEVDEREVSPVRETPESRPRWMTPGEAPAARTEQVGGVIEPVGTGAGDDASGDRTPRNRFWGRRVHRRPRTTLTEVTGHGKPPGALVPFTGQIPVQGGSAGPEERESDERESQDEPARG